MFFFPIFLLLSLALLAWLVAQWPARASGGGAVDVARRRLVSGEISEEQYREIQRTLGGAEATPPAAGGVPALIALVTALLFLGMSVWMVAWTARGGDWDWSAGHMGRMMRWDRPSAGSTLQTDAFEVSVQIRNFDYSPRTIEVQKGARVTWTNEDAVPHTATDRAKVWETGTLARGASATKTFESPGIFAYYCTIHPSMVGTVVVRP